MEEALSSESGKVALYFVTYFTRDIYVKFNPPNLSKNVRTSEGSVDHKVRFQGSPAVSCFGRYNLAVSLCSDLDTGVNTSHNME